jgi:hypothetical protein
MLPCGQRVRWTENGAAGVAWLWSGVASGCGELELNDEGPPEGNPTMNASSAMLTGRPERYTLRLQVPVRELEARPGERPVEGIYIMRLSITPRVKSRSRSRGPGSPAGTLKPKTPRLTAQQAGAVPVRVMGAAGPLRIFSESCFLGSMSYERPTRNGWAASYVCDHCLVECDGLYRVGEKWLCAACNPPSPLSR